VIPNRDRPALIRTCLEGLLKGTAYPKLEIVVVDNGSTDPATLDLYRSLADERRVEVIERPGAFNFSKLTNAGVASSRGELVMMLNNDIEVIGPDWLDLMVAETRPADIGAVGAKLLYPGGRIQHSGVAIGLGGEAGHVYRGQQARHDVWMQRLSAPHEVSAVTGACLAVSREKYDAVGGLDEEVFPIAFNDIDFCLKLRERGWRNIVAPSAVLYHHESASRGRDVGPKQAQAEREARAFRDKWLSVIRDDPYFHPGLSSMRFDLSLG
jgi:GT2 family glycosyltransferase